MIKGYSLIEVIITLSVFSILMFFTMPMLLQFKENVEAQTLQQIVMHTLEQAQGEADAFHLPIGLCASDNQRQCSTESGGYQLIFLDEYHNGDIAKPEQILHVHPTIYSGKLYWRAFPRYRNYLLFFSSRIKRVDNATFWYCTRYAKKVVWAVVLNRFGRVRSITPNQQGEIIDATGKVLHC